MASSLHPVDITDRLRRLVLGLLAILLSVMLIASFLGMLYFVQRNGLLTSTYSLTVTLPDAEGVAPGDAVSLAGVTIGHVETAVTQGPSASLRLQIKSEDKIPQGSRFVAVPALFSIPASLKVVPPDAIAAPSAVIAANQAGLIGESGEDPLMALNRANSMITQWTEVGQKTSRMLDATTRTTRHVDEMMSNGETQKQFHETVNNLERTSRNGAKVSSQMSALLTQTQGHSQSFLNRIEDTSRQMNDASRQIASLTRTSRPQVSAILTDVHTATSTAAGITRQGSSLLQNAQASKPLAATLSNISATAANLKDLTEKMNAIAGNVQIISGDPETAGDVKKTLHNLQSTSAQMDVLAANAQTLTGDPQVQTDLKETLHRLNKLTETTQKLLAQQSAVAKKAR